MLSKYTKTFIIRDCFIPEIMETTEIAINKLLDVEQITGDKGTFLSTDFLYVGASFNGFEINRNQEDGSIDLLFTRGYRDIAHIPMLYFREVHLCFEIEEDMDTDKIQIEGCTVKGFKEYQL